MEENNHSSEVKKKWNDLKTSDKVRRAKTDRQGEEVQ